MAAKSKIAKRDHPAWGIIGKIATVLTILGFLTSIPFWALPKRIRIVGSAVVSDFILPPDMSRSYSNARSAESASIMRDTLKKMKFISDNKLERYVLDIASSISESIDAAWGDQYRHRLEQYNRYILFSVKNRGKLIARNVRIVIPRDGIYRLSSNTKPTVVDRFYKSIEIGILEPNTTLSIQVWTDSVFTPEEDEHYITHAEGTAAIEFAYPTFGIPKFLATNRNYLAPWIIMLLSAAGFLYYLSRLITATIKRKKDESKQK